MADPNVPNNNTLWNYPNDNYARCRARYWVFTLNNYTEDDEFYLLNLPYDDANPIVYLKYGRETGERCQTKHLQGQLECAEQIRFGTLNALFQHRAWLAPRRGTFEEADAYVSKDGETEVAGHRVSQGQGKRNDLSQIQDLIKTGSSLELIAEEHFGSFVRYHRGIEKYMKLLLPVRNWEPEISVYWGPTGTGKTRAVYDENENWQDIYKHTGEKWFDGYFGQSVVLFDEFHGGSFHLAYLLQLLDRYPMQVPTKGSFVNFIPKKVYITSNIDPRLWFPNANPEHVAALFRRINRIVHFACIQDRDCT